VDIGDLHAGGQARGDDSLGPRQPVEKRPGLEALAGRDEYGERTALAWRVVGPRIDDVPEAVIREIGAPEREGRGRDLLQSDHIGPELAERRSLLGLASDASGHVPGHQSHYGQLLRRFRGKNGGMNEPSVATALLVIDMFNAYDFEDAGALLESAERATPVIRDLTQRAGDEGTALIFVNDNYGDWNASRDVLVDRALEGRGGRFLEQLAPRDDALMIHKARHSIFYQTPLEHLLHEKGVLRLVLTGQVTEQCILYSALDAYLRHFEIVVPEDAVAGIHPHLAEAALEMMRVNMGVDTRADAVGPRAARQQSGAGGQPGAP
jgi:nicotinamidase-related amidase